MSMPDIRSWLANLGLGDHAPMFEENRIDFDVLAELTEADLRELGLPLGDRKRLIRAIEDLTSDEAAEPEGERRQVAVLFADISGFTSLAAERDAEETHQLLNRFFAAVDVVVQGFGGNIDKHIGDAVMAVFGAPIAHTDDPERAVRAALAVHIAAAELEPPLRVHIGVAAGQVVASRTGSAAHQEYTVTGDTVNLASRLTDLAKAGETLISASVQAELADRLEGESLGQRILPGLPETVAVFRVDAIAEARVFAGGNFIGRSREIELCRSALEATLREGAGRALYFRGEAGIGKSRLLHECQRLAQERGFQVHGGQVLDFGAGEGQDAIAMLLRGLLGLAPGAGPNQRTVAAADTVEAGLIEAAQRPHLNDLLNLSQDEEERVLFEAMDNAQRNQGRIDVLATMVENLAARSPLLLCLEDLHWAQGAVLEHLAALVTVSRSHPVMLLLTSRIQGDPIDAAWYERVAPAVVERLDLQPLDAGEALQLIGDFHGINRDHAAVFIERAGGNPLFLEQLLRSAESDEGDVIPGSVQSVVQARIDALPARDRAALQAASVLGQRFTLEALRHLMDDGDYQPDNLLHYNMIRRSEGAFQFYHALFRETVHGAFLTERRQQLHLRAADWFQDRDAVLHAEHLGEAGSDRAAGAFERAARAEAAAFRIEQALALVDRGMSFLASGSNPFDLTVYRADLLRELGRPAEALEAWQAALELAETDEQRCPVWIGIAAANRLMGQGEAALAELDLAEAVARRQDGHKELAEIYFYRGGLAFAAGRFDECLTLQNQTLRHARAAGDPEWEATALGGLMDAEYARGRMRNALDNLDRCLALCREHGILRIEARNRFMRGVVGRYLHTQAESITALKEAIDLSDRIHDVRGAMMPRLISSEILIDMAQYDAADVPLQQALSIARSLGNRRIELYLLYEAARRFFALKESGQALEHLEQAISMGRETGIHFHGPRLFALRARLSGDQDECMRWLDEGAALVSEGANAHNVLWFYRDAIDACLAKELLAQARDYCDALTAYTGADPLPWADFFAARGRALADCADGKGDREEVQRVSDQGQELGLLIGLPELQRHLS